MSLHACKIPGCQSLLPRGETYCVKHAHYYPDRDLEQQEKRKRAYGPNWGKTSAWWRWVHPLCQRCRTKASTHVHHIVEAASFDSHEEANKDDNLQALCTSCHSKITAERQKHPFGKGKTFGDSRSLDEIIRSYDGG